jgi:SNF2 family DNA or RNA helicase
MDRSHRLGQRNSVTVYRLIAESTIEERIFSLRRFKSAMAAEVVDNDSTAHATTGTLGEELWESMMLQADI